MSAPQKTLRLANLLLVLACLALGWTIHRQLNGDRAGSVAGDAHASATAQPASAPLPMSASGAVFRPAALSAYDEIVARPLFQRSRRPAVAESAPAPQAVAAEPLRLFLAGIVEDAGRKWAFVKIGQDPLMHRVSLGGSVAGWTVEVIGAESVTLMKEGETVRLAMRAGHRERATPPAGTGNSLGLPSGGPTGIGREQDDNWD